jgi:hypothetical protein
MGMRIFLPPFNPVRGELVLPVECRFKPAIFEDVDPKMASPGTSLYGSSLCNDGFGTLSGRGILAELRILENSAGILGGGKLTSSWRLHEVSTLGPGSIHVLAGMVDIHMSSSKSIATT